jgi:hypothetical protein
MPISTYACRSDGFAHQTRHRSPATLGAYVRVETAWQDNAATQLGL